jgi:hypothetical protein
MAREQRSPEEAKAIEEWLAKGNKITICDPNARSDYEDIAPAWGKRKKKKAAPKKVDKSKK